MTSGEWQSLCVPCRCHALLIGEFFDTKKETETSGHAAAHSHGSPPLPPGGRAFAQEPETLEGLVERIPYDEAELPITDNCILRPLSERAGCDFSAAAE